MKFSFRYKHTLFCLLAPPVPPYRKRVDLNPPADIMFKETGLLQYVQVTLIWLGILRCKLSDWTSESNCALKEKYQKYRKRRPLLSAAL